MTVPSDLRIAWYRNSDGRQLIRFPPALWQLLVVVARLHGATPVHEAITRYIDHLIQANAKSDPSNRELFALEWQIPGKNVGKKRPADVVFPVMAVATIAKLWEMTEDEARDALAKSLLKTIAEQVELAACGYEPIR